MEQFLTIQAFFSFLIKIKHNFCFRKNTKVNCLCFLCAKVLSAVMAIRGLFFKYLSGFLAEESFCLSKLIKILPFFLDAFGAYPATRLWIEPIFLNAIVMIGVITLVTEVQFGFVRFAWAYLAALLIVVLYINKNTSRRGLFSGRHWLSSKSESDFCFCRRWLMDFGIMYFLRRNCVLLDEEDYWSYSLGIWVGIIRGQINKLGS